ncbi:MAG: hypothetical protein KDD43_13920, partial [Bdellovibrionales bacterium]|nr:hypothetical protein [Bdellovibrionales bacterium]
YLSYGDATDDCNWSTSQVLTKAIWNCDDLTIASGVIITFDLTQVTSVVQLRVQGSVNIAGRIDVSATATNPGPGGTAGGDCDTGGIICTLQDGVGSTGGEGKGGQTGDDLGANLAADGGGGGGAGFSVVGEAGDAGANVGGGTNGAGGAAGAQFVSALSLNTTLQAGVGGGAGGSGDTGFAIGDGGDGGNGSGSLVIVSKGDISLAATAELWAKGRIGQDGTSNVVEGGNGGGGSGGAIYLVTAGTLTSTTASVDISGGATNTNGAGSKGGKGSDGLFRVDTESGTFTGSFNITSPDGITTASFTTPDGILDPLDVATTSGSVDLESDISPSCTYRVNGQISYRFLTSLIFGFLMAFLLFQFYKYTWNFIVSNRFGVTKS